MDNPTKDIVAAIDECAASKSAHDQIQAIHKYFTPNASFLHPLIYIPPYPCPSSSSPTSYPLSSPFSFSVFPSLLHNIFQNVFSSTSSASSSSSSQNSYKSITSIIAAYSTYRTCIPTTRFEITSIAFDQQSSTHGKLFVDLYQYPYVRVVSYILNDWRPKLEMHVHFWLVRDDDGSSVGEGEDDENEGNSERRGGERRDSSRKPMGKWMIAKQEDTIQPFSAILAIPLFIPLAWFISVVNVIAAWCVMGVGMLFGLWRATGSRRKARVE